jgi:hypothetical protein
LLTQPQGKCLLLFSKARPQALIKLNLCSDFFKPLKAHTQSMKPGPGKIRPDPPH